MFALGSDEGHMALIGDISPDFPPEFYRGLPAVGLRLLTNKNQSDPAGQPRGSFWQTFFGTTASSPTGNWLAENGSWATLSHNSWRLLMHADTEVSDPRVTHGHHDLFSFDLSYDGLPLIVDPGRRNYSLSRDSQGAGILEEWHNTLMLDGIRTGFCPRGYMPSVWLESFRMCPTVVQYDDTLRVSLSDCQLEGVSLIERSFVRKQDGGLKIVSTLVLSESKPRSLRLVLHLAGEVEIVHGGANITQSGTRFFLPGQSS